MIRTLEDYIFGGEHDRTTITLKFDTPPVSNSASYEPLSEHQMRNLLIASQDTTVYDKDGQWSIKTYHQKIVDDVLDKVLKAAMWLDANCTSHIEGEDSPHIGWWRHYALQIYLSLDARMGADAFCNMPGVPELFHCIDGLFAHADSTLCRVFQAVQPDGERVCGSSFLMAVVNRGGLGPHIDSQDWNEGCCCVVPFGSDWTGGELVFRDLGLGFTLKPGDVIFFRSAILVHENMPFEGDRRSIVLTTDRNSFTAVGQPLEPSVVAATEQHLLEKKNRYTSLSPDASKKLLHERMQARAHSKPEADSNVCSDRKAELRSKLLNRPQPLHVKDPAIVDLLSHRLDIRKDPLRAKKLTGKAQSTHVNTHSKKEAGANAASRNLFRK